MATHPGLHISPTADNTGTMPRDARLAFGGLLAPDSAANLSVRTGVLFDNGSKVVSGTTGLQINVRPCRVVSKFSDGNGPTVFAISATETPTMNAPPGSGSRIDILYALQPLVTGDGGSGGTSVQPVVGYVAGDASGAPVAPTIPVGAVELGRGTVSAGMVRSNQVAWTAPAWTVANGGVVPDGRRGQVQNGGQTLSLVSVETGTITSTPAWTATGSDQRWTRHDRLITLSGGYTFSSNLPASATGTAGLQLYGVPLPSRDRGLLIRSGNRLLSGWIDPTGLIQWAVTIGTGNSSNITLDGLTYEVPS